MYQIFYHPLVQDEDFKKLNIAAQRKIVKTIKKKLTADPIAFGKPLQGALKGYYRLRVDFYRVIYKIEKKKVMVFIIKIGLRKDMKAYVEAGKRLGFLK